MEYSFWSYEYDWTLKMQSFCQVFISQMPLERLINDLIKEFGHLEDLSNAEDQIYEFIIARKLASLPILLTLILSHHTIFPEIS